MDSNEGIVTLKNIVERLIAPDGCPWDRVQTPESLSEYIIEESHELVSAIRYGDADDVCEELGDVAFLLVTIACHFEKKGAFTLDDVFRRNAAKMVHRHPHVFGNEKFASLDDQLKAWEKLKKEEHQKEGKATGVFASLPRDPDSARQGLPHPLQGSQNRLYLGKRRGCGAPG